MHLFNINSIYAHISRFLLVVVACYRQVRSQSAPLMSEIDEDNFDRAFSLIRPVIQGTADISKQLTEDELERTIDFCRNIVAPTDPEEMKAVASRVSKEILSVNAPVYTSKQISDMVGEEDEEARRVVEDINARKPIYVMTGKLELEEVEGLKVELKRGELGLVAA